MEIARRVMSSRGDGSLVYGGYPLSLAPCCSRSSGRCGERRGPNRVHGGRECLAGHIAIGRNVVAVPSGSEILVQSGAFSWPPGPGTWHFLQVLQVALLAMGTEHIAVAQLWRLGITVRASRRAYRRGLWVE